MIFVMLACCCLLTACCLRLLWKRSREKSSQPRSVPGNSFDLPVNADDVRAVDAALRARGNATAVRSQGSSHSQRADCVEALHIAFGDVSSDLQQINTCTQPPVEPRMSKLWQAGSLAEPPVNVSCPSADSCRLEYEGDHHSSEPTQSKPSRDSEREMSSSRTSNLLNSLRSSFGRVRV